tara:strand:+ start:379 stop:849 length:471 start_codon:yes stop_codon:yes gene_type:complete
MSFDIKLIEKNKILDIWPKISHHAENLERRSHGRYNKADILHQMIELPYFVWIVWEDENPIGFFICGINVYPRKKYLDFNTLSGVRLKEWGEQALEVVEVFAKSLQLDGLEASVSPALEKKWEENGFKKEYVVITKPVIYEEDEADQPVLEVVNGR